MTARLVGVLIAATALADQLSKALALSKLALGEPVGILPGFNLTLGFNTGASFGLLDEIMAGRPLLMAALTGALALAFAVMAFRARRSLERVGLALIVGGALGNFVDRLRQGAVTDFLGVYWRDWHWPAFNIAAIGITLGALCILLSALPSRRRKEPAFDRH